MSPNPPLRPPDEPDPALGRVVQSLREERGLSRADLASRSGVDEAVLAQLERGELDPPWTTVEAIAAGLEIPVHDLATAATAEDAEAP